MAAQVHPSAVPVSMSLTLNVGSETRSLGTIPLQDVDAAAALVRQIAALVARTMEEQWKPEKPKE